LIGQSTVYFRFVDMSCTSIVGNLVSVLGTARLDNVIVASSSVAANGAPVQTGTAPTAVFVYENAANTTAASLGMNGLNYSPGTGALDSGQTLTYKITGVPSYIQVFLADGTTSVSVNDKLTLDQMRGLTFKTLANTPGTGSLTWSVQDNGGTANGGRDTLTQSLSITVANAAPTISFTVTAVSGKDVVLAGQVTDEHPGGLIVGFSGQYSGTAVTNADGTFQVQVTATGLGTIQASTTDGEGLGSNTASATVTSNAPVIENFQVVREAGLVYILTGRVEDEDAVGLEVSFGGLGSLESKTAVVQADGTFSLEVEFLEGEEGTATAQTTDWWGLVSQIAESLVRPS